MRVILTGGGTAGHINPALAIAGYLKDKEPNTEILYVGKKSGMEEDLVKKAGFDSGHKQKIYEYGWDFKYVENYSKNLSTIDIETMTRRLLGFISEHKNTLPN